MFHSWCSRVICIAPLLGDGGLVSRFLWADSNKNVYSWRRKVVVDRSSFRSVSSLFHARGAATEKALTPIRRRVRGTTRSPDDEARSADRAGSSATDVSKSEMYIGVCPRTDLWTSKLNLYWILSATGNWCNSRRAGVIRSRGSRSRTALLVHPAVCMQDHFCSIKLRGSQRFPSVL